MEESDPDHHEQSVEEAKWGIEPICRLSVIIVANNNHDIAENAPNNHWRYKPASIVNKPGEVKRHFFSIVVFDDIEWLHVVLKFCRQHTKAQSESVVYPTVVNLFSHRHMYREMLRNHLVFHQVIKVKFLSQNLCHDELHLTTVKL